MNPLYRQAAFLSSAAKLSQAPADEGYEVAFAGRSNSGKSSAINALCDQKTLARTSKTPGRTQLLNFFAVDAQRRIVRDRLCPKWLQRNDYKSQCGKQSPG